MGYPTNKPRRQTELVSTQTSCLAVLAARTELCNREYLLPTLIANGIKITVLDHA